MTDQSPQKSATIFYQIAEKIYRSATYFIKEKCEGRKQALIIGIPFLWLIIFYLIPFLYIFKISFTLPIIGKPPISELVEFLENETFQLKLTFSNFLFLFEDKLYLFAYLNSIKIAFISTCLCLLIGYPIAYSLAQIQSRHKLILLILVIMPLWVPFLIRIYAWIIILKPSGLLNQFLLTYGLISEPLQILYTDLSVFIGITYSYLPFMILPLYAILEKMDRSLIEAAEDLGCKPFSVFTSIILPLSMPGVIAGSMLVFIPAVGEYVIPELLGGPDNLMIGKLIWTEFFANQDWPIASAFAILLLLVLIIPIVIFKIAQHKTEKEAF